MAKPLFSSLSSISFTHSHRLLLSPNPILHPFSPFNFKQRTLSIAPAINLTIAHNVATSTKSITELIESLVNGVDLSEAEAEASLHLLLDEGNEALISAFLVLLRAKLETFEEVVGLARGVIKHARKVEGLVDGVDIVGRVMVQTPSTFQLGLRYLLLLEVPKLPSKETVQVHPHVEVPMCWKNWGLLLTWNLRG